NAKAIPLQKNEIVESAILKNASSHADKGEWLHDIGNAITMYDRFWTELKTGK
ncbi:MAG TPA: spermidine/putrescine ABC transporter substrate-binding protein, partial [Acidaminococcaceae bacterium]|nr:spermidine/putrescine ABC transporter substrate-binding protein [Acidaminococcaceae bacterium]